MSLRTNDKFYNDFSFFYFYVVIFLDNNEAVPQKHETRENNKQDGIVRVWVNISIDGLGPAGRLVNTPLAARRHHS